MPGETLRERLLPCPFCGGEAEIWRAHDEPYRRGAWVACMGKCGSGKRGTVLTTEYDTDAEVIAAWNRRSDAALAAEVERLREALEQIAEQCLLSEAPEGIDQDGDEGPEWHRGYDAAILAARAALEGRDDG